MVPPPQHPHAEPRAKLQKTSNSNSPNQILFVDQRKTVKFPQNKFLHLVTHFSVCLREHPFSEPSLKNPKPKIRFNPVQSASNSSFLTVPLLRDRELTLINRVSRFNVTHLLIFLFIQNTFSHKFLKPF
jgi:hypothetical protein